MGFERQPGSREALDAALRAFEANVAERQQNTRHFESPTGYHVSIETFPNRDINFTLSKNGNTSSFSLEADGPRFASLRGPDDELIQDQRLKEHHLSEAERLFQSGDLTTHEAESDGQYEMDI